MPGLRTLPRLEVLCQTQLSSITAALCSKLETLSHQHHDGEDDEWRRQHGACAAFEAKLCAMMRALPGTVLETLIPLVLRNIAQAMRKNRSHKGLLKALDVLPQPAVKRLDMGALFSEVRLYGEVNGQCKRLLRASLLRLPALTHLNLESKCTDDILVGLAQHCPRLEKLRIPMSDVSDRGLMALGGLSVGDVLKPGQGCFALRHVSLRNCFNVTTTGVGCLLRNLPLLIIFNFAKTLDAVENVARIDGDYLSGKKAFHITHLDQFSDFYEFDGHPEIMSILLRVCPKLESLRFYLSDEGCKSLSLIGGIKHLQLEMEDIGNGFRQLTRQYTNLVTLQLTFRAMPFSQLIDIADNCPNLAVLRLMGFEISDSHNLVSHNNVFSKLRVIDLRMVRNCPYADMDEPEPMDLDSVDTITPQLMHFVLDFSHALEELTVQAVANFMSESFLASVFERNPLSELRKLDLSVTPGTQLTSRVARMVMEQLPELNVLGMSRWNVSSSEAKALMAELRKANLEMTFL